MLAPIMSAALVTVHARPAGAVMRGSTLVPQTWMMRRSYLWRHPGWISPDAAGKALLYVANYNASNVQIYDAVGKNQSPIGSITNGLSGPEGMAVDKHRNLYVTNTSNNTVTVYKFGQTSPYKTYSAGLNGPAGAVVGDDGTVYVSNLYGNDVVAYAKGKKHPTTTYTGLNFPIAVTLDSSNDLFVTNSGAQDIIEYLAGSTTPMNTGISLPIPSGIEIDQAGNIVVADQNPPGIYVYPPGQTNPSKVFGQEGDPNPIAFLSSEKLLFVGEPLTPAVNVYTYPKGRKVNVITNSVTFPAGVAVSPKNPF